MARIRRPGRIRQAALVGGWVLVALMIGGFSLLGPFLVVLLPVLFLGTLGIVTSLHTWADADPTCAACGVVRLDEAWVVERSDRIRDARPSWAALAE